ncbi:MAG: Diaminopropionate ammonia-lyase [Herbaspirillum frisingense]|uniref:Diaminopropionate ammonia-lyase n=1 Tax=Herbaspirillum frisingense TaxID=92645 RepID=A0A7V8FYR4_9BURK|nr:MAG: Diaminopropionate ammonia-lyase [Herbaspirillum frisingense]
MLKMNTHPRSATLPELAALGPAAAAAVRDLLRQCPAYRPTPLLDLPRLAQELGLAQLAVKDESQRFGLGAFKALGGIYAVLRLGQDYAAARLQRTPHMAELLDGSLRELMRGLTMVCASAGNHGKAVAAGCRLLGCRALIYVHRSVRPCRLEAIRAQGAEVRQLDLGYDDAVAQAGADARAHGYVLVSDTAGPGGDRVTGWVMQGYTALIDEALEQLPQPPTHVFVQAGVGGLAGAAAAYLAAARATVATRVIVVEPRRAACLLHNADAAVPARIAAEAPSVMSMLDCREPSLLAWRVLRETAYAYLAVEEDEAVHAVRRWAAPSDGDPRLLAGASGATGLAGLLHAGARAPMREALGLDAAARVLLINSEGPNDTQAFTEQTGLSVVWPAQASMHA